MMYNFPFFPHFYPRPYYNYPQNSTKDVNYNNTVNSNATYNSKHYNNSIYTNGNNNSYNSKLNSRENNRKKNFSDKHLKEKKENKEENKFIENDDTIFEIFGIKLHFDDILLICLIFFLYNEGVKDEFLFIALVLLLLS